MAPERMRAPGPDLTTALVPEMTPESVSELAALPYCWTKSCVPADVRLALMVSAAVTVLSTRIPPLVSVRRKPPLTVETVVPVRRRALADWAAVSAVVAAEMV